MYIEPNAFHVFREYINFISLGKGQLEFVEVGVFDEMTQLESLELHDNRISYVEYGSFPKKRFIPPLSLSLSIDSHNNNNNNSSDPEAQIRPIPTSCSLNTDLSKMMNIRVTILYPYEHINFYFRDLLLLMISIRDTDRLNPKRENELSHASFSVFKV